MSSSKRKSGLSKQTFASPSLWDCPVVPPGTEINGEYRADGFLKQGGFGAVYRLTKLSDPNVHAALKIFSGDLEHDLQQGRERIQREIDVIRSVRQPYVPEYYFSGEYEGRPYFVMEYMDAFYEEEGLPEEDWGIREFVLQILDSLEALHQAGWIHSDIKPGNIVRRFDDGRYVLIDFGGAHHQEDNGNFPTDATKRMGVVGTPGYDPPDLCFRPCRDIFSVGRVIRDCFKEDVPLGWSLIINKCISNNMRYRYRDVAALREDVQNIDQLGHAEMQRYIYQDRFRSLDLQAYYMKDRPTTYSWARLKSDIERKMGHDALFVDVGQVYIDFDLLGTRKIEIKLPVVLKKDRYIIIKGPGVVVMDLSAELAVDENRRGKGNAAFVFLWNNVTLINTSSKPLEEGNVFYAVSASCYLNFPNISSKKKIDWSYCAESNLGFAMISYGGHNDFADMLERKSTRIEKCLKPYLKDKPCGSATRWAQPILFRIQNDGIIREQMGLRPLDKKGKGK